MAKVWYLKHPTSKFYEEDVKKTAIKAGAKILDIKFIGDKENAKDCPKIKVEKSKEAVK